ncbi:phosphotransferase-like protein [Nocardia carnea]|uniref:phosphotransferase-like protein n=1 Tax=Nocardia carnea TaxID=37328 RepID=UPI002456A3AA|nr:hypothetical protein [Nocardia carnea]
MVIRYGPVGRRILHSACTAAAAFAHGGDNLVIDEMLLSPDLLPVWSEALAGLDVRLVAVTCPLEVAEQRERVARTRPDWPGDTSMQYTVTATPTTWSSTQPREPRRGRRESSCGSAPNVVGVRPMDGTGSGSTGREAGIGPMRSRSCPIGASGRSRCSRTASASTRLCARPERSF